VLAIAALCAVVGTARIARPESALALRLSIEGTAGCVDPGEFLALLQARSAHIRKAAPGETAPTLQIQIAPSGDHVAGKLTVVAPDGSKGSREVRGEDCESVASGLAFVAVVILDPSAVLLTGPSRATGTAAASSTPAATAIATTSSPISGPSLNPISTPTATGSVAAPTPAPLLAPVTVPGHEPPPFRSASTPRDHPLRLSLGWALALASGLGPDPQVLPGVFIDLYLEPSSSWLARTSARLTVDRGFTTAIDTPNGTADITLTDIRLEPCFDAWSLAAFRARACGLVEVGVLNGEGRSTSAPKNETRASLELGLGIRPTWIVREGFSVGVLIAGALPTARYRFYFDNPFTTAYQLGAWSAIGELGVGVRFW
jgi:hypothetical protein